MGFCDVLMMMMMMTTLVVLCPGYVLTANKECVFLPLSNVRYRHENDVLNSGERIVVLKMLVTAIAETHNFYGGK